MAKNLWTAGEEQELSRPEPPGTSIELVGRPSSASQVLAGLWVGGAPPPTWRAAAHFDCLVLCACEYQLDCWGGVMTARASLNDDGSPMRDGERVEAVRAAGKVIAWLASGQRVLVTCMQGRNRSGLVAALALCKGPPRMSPDAAVAAVRAARGPNALSNPYFVRFLKSYCG